MNNMNLEELKRIKECEGIVYKFVNKYKNYCNFEDLYQAGLIGVIKASRKYKNNENCKFTSYAFKYILGEIIDYLRKDRNIIVSDEIYDLYKKYTKTKDLLYLKNEKEPSFDEVCSFMEIDKQYMLNIIESISFAKSIDDDEKLYNEYGYDDTNNIDNKILLNDELELLNDNDRNLINYRYYQGFSQMETAELLGLSQAKVSRQEKLILNRIRDKIST